MSIIKDRNDFKQKSQKFLENDLLNVLYTTDDLCVCNVVNYCYVIFDYRDINGSQYGFVTDANTVKRIVESPIALYQVMNSLDKETLRKLLMPLNDAMFASLQRRKVETDLKGPSPTINYEIEKYLLDLNGKKKGR